MSQSQQQIFYLDVNVDNLNNQQLREVFSELVDTSWDAIDHNISSFRTAVSYLEDFTDDQILRHIIKKNIDPDYYDPLLDRIPSADRTHYSANFCPPYDSYLSSSVTSSSPQPQQVRSESPATPPSPQVIRYEEDLDEVTGVEEDQEEEVFLSEELFLSSSNIEAEQPRQARVRPQISERRQRQRRARPLPQHFARSEVPLQWIPCEHIPEQQESQRRANLDWSILMIDIIFMLTNL